MIMSPIGSATTFFDMLKSRNHRMTDPGSLLSVLFALGAFNIEPCGCYSVYYTHLRWMLDTEQLRGHINPITNTPKYREKKGSKYTYIHILCPSTPLVLGRTLGCQQSVVFSPIGRHSARDDTLAEYVGTRRLAHLCSTTTRSVFGRKAFRFETSTRAGGGAVDVSLTCLIAQRLYRILDFCRAKGRL